jgi:hypothetical protein
MSDEHVPEDVRDFILRHITSIAQLEALLLLWRDPEVTWGVPSMARRLYISKRQTIAILAQLKADGLIVVDETARVRGIEPQHQELVGRLAEAYATQLIPITNIIHTRPRRIRKFAGAFKLRKAPSRRLPPLVRRLHAIADTRLCEDVPRKDQEPSPTPGPAKPQQSRRWSALPSSSP